MRHEAPFPKRPDGLGSISSRRALRRAAALAAAGLFVALTVGGCSRQGEGERCDRTANGDEDCEDGLFCVTKVGNVDRCCPPSGAPIDDSRCSVPDAPSGGLTGGTSGGGTDGGGTNSGGTSGSSTSGGTSGGDTASGGTVEPGGAGGEAPGAGGAGGENTAGSAGESSAGAGGEP